MAPNPLAQEAVLREAYRRAGVSPGHVQYVEAHGTGTFLGDPIEAQALGTVLAIDRPPGRPCAMGSVKTNLGHLEAAAGVAADQGGVGAQASGDPTEPALSGAQPHIPFDDLLSECRQRWVRGLRSRVQPGQGSSFGFGGTNAHVVLEEAPSRIRNAECRTAENAMRNPRESAHLLPLSARSPEALQSLARVYQNFLAAPEATLSLHDICYTASVRRSHHDYRLP
jgi:acyl transferase domain-containing protein